MHKFNRTINIIGKDMYKVDIQGSVAYAKGLARAGILNDHEESEMVRGLKLVEEEWDQGVVSLTVEKDSDLSSTSKTTMRTFLPQTKGG
jgi:argininosuccinate lyase